VTSGTGGVGHGGVGHGGGERAVPYVCPFCGEEDLRPADQGRWHCRSCLRLFSLTFHGVAPAASLSPRPASAPPPPTPASGIRLPVTPDAARADALTLPDDDDLFLADDDPTFPGSSR
jgi:hypothetical protein